MAMVLCNQHGLSGVDLVTPSIASAVMAGVEIEIINVDIRWEDVEIARLVDRGFLEGLATPLVGGAIVLNDEDSFNEIYGAFIPICIHCFRDYLAGSGKQGLADGRADH